MNKKRIDAPFLSKFNRKSVYFDSEEEICNSIINEIGNILSSKLKITDKSEETPFSYGIRDLQSVDNSQDAIEEFKDHCIRQILRYEPRVEEVYINECNLNKMNQTLEIELVCKIRGQDHTLNTKILL